MVAYAAAGIVVIIIGIQLVVPHFLPAIFTTIARPFWRMEFSLGSGSLNSPQALLAENESLKLQLDNLNVRQQSVQAVINDNSELLALLGRPDASSTLQVTNIQSVTSTSTASSTSISYLKSMPGIILAAVLVQPPIISYDELLIDIGADHGIAPGSKVYAPGNVLIGTTTDIFSQTAKVKLFSSPGETYPVLIGPTHIPATAVGRGGGQYQAEVPQASKINQDDIVSDSSINDAPFGIVSAVLANPADPFETVLFAPPVNIYQLRWVLVATTTKK
jgi:cell shape-determining protein MreC